MNKLRKYLKHRGISQLRFSEMIGTTPNNLGLLCLEKSCPSLQMAWRIQICTGGLVTLEDWIPQEWKSFEPLPPVVKEKPERKKRKDAGKRKTKAKKVDLNI